MAVTCTGAPAMVTRCFFRSIAILPAARCSAYSTGGERRRRMAFTRRNEFARAEGFHHVIVDAEFEAEDAIDFLGARAEQQDGDRRSGGLALQFAADFDATQAGHHDVQHCERRGVAPR